MHLVIHKDDLSRAITAAGRVVESRNTMPILGNLLLSAGHDGNGIPVAGETIVDVEFDDGDIVNGTHAEFWTGGMESWDRSQNPTGSKIKEYRISAVPA